MSDILDAGMDEVEGLKEELERKDGEFEETSAVWDQLEEEREGLMAEIWVGSGRTGG